MSWTYELSTMAESLWLEGKSGTEVSIHLRTHGLHVTRSAVIGKLKRMGVKRTTPDAPKATRVKKSRDRAISANQCKPLKDIPLKQIEAVRVDPVGIFDLGPRHCRWPVSGEGAATMFCGHAKVKGGHSAYCKSHLEIGTRPKSKGGEA